MDKEDWKDLFPFYILLLISITMTLLLPYACYLAATISFLGIEFVKENFILLILLYLPVPLMIVYLLIKDLFSDD